MPDSKYRRLFTESDVLAIVDEALGADPDRLVGDDVPLGERMPAILDVLIKRAEADKAPMRFPADEPLFLLRGQDGAAVPAIRDYGYRADAVGAGAVHLGNVSIAALKMEQWQAANPDRVKVPD